uniref:Putative secreted protein n=1 Tax=Panstrongylus lignarius TaxID=156445 RepID=A0A224XTU1_9HEMI
MLPAIAFISNFVLSCIPNICALRFAAAATKFIAGSSSLSHVKSAPSPSASNLFLRDEILCENTSLHSDIVHCI